MLPQVIFVQNSVHLAGAQKSLSRLLAAEEMRSHDPLLLTGEKGWLTEHCQQHGVPWVQLPFPSSRSLTGRLWGNRLFARRAANQLRPLLKSGRPLIVHTNDHPDSLLGLALATELQATPVMTLRTPGMSRRDFDKYHCARHHHLISVGEGLFQKVTPWLQQGRPPLTLIHNGVTEEEILSPREDNTATLQQVLVLGSIIPRKGWQDLMEALLILEKTLPAGPLPEIHFLGDLLNKPPDEVLQTGRLHRFKVTFLGVDKEYRARLRRYALALHPSRSESFGMAALECVAAGVPLLAAATGVIPEFIPCPAFLHTPQNSQELAEHLRSLLTQSPAQLATAFDFMRAHEIIRERFATQATVRRLHTLYHNLLTSSHPVHP